MTSIQGILSDILLDFSTSSTSSQLAKNPDPTKYVLAYLYDRTTVLRAGKFFVFPVHLNEANSVLIKVFLFWILIFIHTDVHGLITAKSPGL